jgi:hypothetical protein
MGLLLLLLVVTIVMLTEPSPIAVVVSAVIGKIFFRIKNSGKKYVAVVYVERR